MSAWVKWLLGIFATLVTAGVLTTGATLAGHGEKLASSEARVDALSTGQHRIEQRLDRLDNKLDRMLEHLLKN